MRPIAVLGDGAWGTALAMVLDKNGHAVRVWGAFPGYAAEVARTRVNRKFLPGVRIPRSISWESDLARAVEGAALVVSVVPAQHLDGVARRLQTAGLAHATPFVSATKGIDMRTLERPSEILRRRFGASPVCVLTGPSHAEEVSRGLPASVVAASRDKRLRKRVQALFGGSILRVYEGNDPVGAELGGALKNVLALAAGICAGLKLGDNARAALLTRGVVEVARVGVAMGARRETFFGLSCLGDLMTTAFSEHSRNFRVGRMLGQGRSLKSILGSMEQVAEGVPTAKAVRLLSRRLKVETPISRQVHAILYEGKSARRAVEALLARPQGRE